MICRSTGHSLIDMQDFLLTLFNYFQESPTVVLKKALSLKYSYVDMFHIVFYYKKTCVDSFLDEKLFMSEINTVSLSDLFDELNQILNEVNAHEGELLEDVLS